MDLIGRKGTSVLDPETTTKVTSSDIAESPIYGSTILPDEPLVRIRPERPWIGVSLRELWTHRELLYFLTWRDLKVRYKQTVLGVAWAIMQPLFTMIIFTLFFGRLAGVPSDGVPYPVFVYAGLIIWTFFSNAVTSSGNSLVGNAQLLSKVYFPRMIIPGSAILAGVVDLAIAFVVLVGLMIYYGTAPTVKFLLVPVLLALITLLSFSVGMWLSALNVKYRDIRFALPFVVQLWMFLSPVIYPSSFVPARWRWLLALNPLTGIIDNFRVSLFGHQAFNWMTLAVATIITLALFIYSTYVFLRMEEDFADIV
jgi:lipopolysaccharide transport system permease protein